MPAKVKLKSHRGAAKRFTLRGNKKRVRIKRRKAFRSHYARPNKTTKRLRHLRCDTSEVNKADIKGVIRMLRGS